MNNRIPYVLAIFATGLFMSCLSITLVAQQKQKTKKEQIVISQKEGKKEKVTIVVDGDAITINGKPLAEYDGDDIVIRRKNIEGFVAPYAYSAPRIKTIPRVYAPGYPDAKMFTSPPGAFSFSLNDDDLVGFDNKAMLGVITEKDDKGAKITEVMKESAAAKAGLMKGDIITHVNGKKVSGPDALADAIGDKEPNDEVEISYLRDNKSRKLKVKLGERKNSYSYNYNYKLPRIEQEFTKPFMELAPFHDDNFFRWHGESRHRLGVRIQETEDSSGVKVLEVEEESVAEKSGIKRDDVITEIDGKKIKDAYSARNAMNESRDKNTYSIRVLRNGSPLNIDVKIPKNLKKTDL